MLIAAIENFIFLNSLLTLFCFALAWIVRRTTERDRWRLHPQTFARFYTVMTIAPSAVSAWLIAAALLPEAWLGDAAFNAAHPAPLHQLHLLGELTATFEPALSYVALSFAAAIALFAAVSSARGYLRVGSVIGRLEMNAAPPPPDQLALVERIAAQRGLKVGLVMSDYPFSFVWGFRRSTLVLSSGLLRILSPEELAGVLEHEAAHHARRDNLIRLILNFCGCASLAFPLSRLIQRWRAEQIEMVCDEVAAGYTSAPLEIAEALVKLRRKTLLPAGNAAVTAYASSFIPDDSTGFARRVRQIIALTDAPPTPSRAKALSNPRKGRAIFIAAVFALTLAAASALAPLGVHQAAESLIQFIKYGTRENELLKDIDPGLGFHSMAGE